VYNDAQEIKASKGCMEQNFEGLKALAIYVCDFKEYYERVL
jgi:hypothetical protein